VSDELSLLVIGGGPAGLSAVRGYRDAGGTGPAAIVSAEERMPYQRPPLTKALLRGEMGEDELALEDEAWLVENSVALISGRAVALDADAHEVTLSGGRGLTYRRCVLATGAEPTRLTCPGCDDPSVRVVRSLDHVRELAYRLGSGGSSVAVIGSGFIGCEIAASLRRRGHPVTLISDEPAPNDRRLGWEAADELAGWLEDEGVTLRLGAGVDAIERDGAGLRISADGTRVDATVIVMATGVAPRSELLAACGAELSSGAVPVNSAMRTAIADVLAAGDVCLAHNATAGRPLRVEHWGDALAQGEIAGRSAAGAEASWDAVPGFWSTIGDHTLKYAAWGDGYDTASFERGPDGGFTAWYGRDGVVVGVLAHEDDDGYERGRELIAAGAPWS
jgi:3-phenylpropionate/trans-cinnamate dioxygenase ferredoxin reductase component